MADVRALKMESESENESESEYESESETESPKAEPLTLKKAVWSILWALAGVMQGFVYCKCLIPYPKVLADQFIFRNFVVLKMFMSAVGSAMVFQAAMSHFEPEQFTKSRSYGQDKFGYVRVVAGLLTLGAGMAIAGNGPTMIPPAIGGSVKTAWFLVVGGLAAAVLVGIVDRVQKSRGKSTWTPVAESDPLMAEGLVEMMTGKTYSYKVLALGMGFFMIMMTLVLEYVVPFKEDVAKYGGHFAVEYPSRVLEYPAWPPILAGCSVGLGQVAVRMQSSTGAGGATAFFTMTSTLTGGFLSPNHSLFKSIDNWWQLIYNFVFVMLGALSARALNPAWALDMTTPPLTDGTPPLSDGFASWKTALGAFLCIAGARFAGGCTCGHGVSGTSELSIESFVGAACIFGGAILTRVIIVYGLGVDY